MVTYGQDENGLVLKHHPIFPTLRLRPNNTHATYQLDIPAERWPSPAINGHPLRERLVRVRLCGLLELETEASEAEITLDDQQDVQQVKLPGEEKPFLVRLLNTVHEILVRGIGSAVGTVLGTASKSLIFGGLTTGQVTAFQIDGEDADIAGYLPQELSDEEVEGQVSTNSNAEPDKNGTSKAQHREPR